MHRILKNVLDTLQQATAKKKFPSEITKFFAVMSGDKGAPPQNYFSYFELARLNFNFFGLYNHSNPEQTKMILINYFLTRILLAKFLINPWKVLPEVKETPQLVK